MEKTEILKVRNGKTQNKKTEEFADETDDRKAEHLVCQSRLYRGSAAIVGEKEKDGPLGEYFSHTLSDPMCGQESWEEGESELQLATAKLAMQKANVRPEQIRMIFAGDLLAQSIASSFGLVDLNCRSTACSVPARRWERRFRLARWQSREDTVTGCWR